MGKLVGLGTLLLAALTIVVGVSLLGGLGVGSSAPVGRTVTWEPSPSAPSMTPSGVSSDGAP